MLLRASIKVIMRNNIKLFDGCWLLFDAYQQQPTTNKRQTNKNMKFLKITILFFAAAAMFSCSSKKIAYFRDINTAALTAQVPDPVIKVGDILSIIVSGGDQNVVAQFNLPFASTSSYGELSGTAGGSQRLQPYIVEKDGTVNIPVLGKITVSGLARQDAVEVIQNKLLAYINKPIVTIQYMNFKVSVLGEVAKPGTYQVTDEKITFPQALGLAGDLTIYGKRNNILLIREKAGGEKEFVRIDLTKADILSSDYYYIKQNDIIYVEPNKTRILSSSSAAITISLSVVSSLASLTALSISIYNNTK